MSHKSLGTIRAIFDFLWPLFFSAAFTFHGMVRVGMVILLFASVIDSIRVMDSLRRGGRKQEFYVNSEAPEVDSAAGTISGIFGLPFVFLEILIPREIHNTLVLVVNLLIVAYLFYRIRSTIVAYNPLLFLAGWRRAVLTDICTTPDVFKDTRKPATHSTILYRKTKLSPSWQSKLYNGRKITATPVSDEVLVLQDM